MARYRWNSPRTMIPAIITTVNAIAIHVLHVLGFTRHIEGLFRIVLHAKCKFERLDARLQLLVGAARCEMTLIEAVEQIELCMLPPRSHSIVADMLDQFFAGHPDRFTWQRPQAGSIGFPKLIGDRVNDFCKELVGKTGVLLLPGTLYDDQSNHFRIGFGRKNFPEAMALLEEFLAR